MYSIKVVNSKRNEICEFEIRPRKLCDRNDMDYPYSSAKKKKAAKYLRITNSKAQAIKKIFHPFLSVQKSAEVTF